RRHPRSRLLPRGAAPVLDRLPPHPPVLSLRRGRGVGRGARVELGDGDRCARIEHPGLRHPGPPLRAPRGRGVHPFGGRKDLDLSLGAAARLLVRVVQRNVLGGQHAHVTPESSRARAWCLAPPSPGSARSTRSCTSGETSNRVRCHAGMLSEQARDALAALTTAIDTFPELEEALGIRWRRGMRQGGRSHLAVEITPEQRAAADLLAAELPAETRSDAGTAGLVELLARPGSRVLLAWCRASAWRRDIRLAPLFGRGAAAGTLDRVLPAAR